MRLTYLLSGTLFIAVLFSGGLVAFAQVNSEVSSLNRAITEKKGNIEQINKRIADYQKKIEQVQAQKTSLNTVLELLDNRIAKTQLEIEETEQGIDLVNAELTLLESDRMNLEKEIEENRVLIASVLQQIQSKDQNMPLELFFGSMSLSQLFDEVQALEIINEDLKQALDKTKQAKTLVEEKRSAQEAKKEMMEEMESTLGIEKQRLEEEMAAQGLLIAQTQRSEDSFRVLLRELKEEQAFINQQISALQKEIEGKLAANDQAGDSSVLSWPINPSARGISSGYHDPTYPYRHLFEHSGIDLPALSGTAIKAAAPGYVAWARKGRQYGNYVMIIHANGIATLYAHMSRIDVSPEQFVARGSVIGAVGSTGLSTGPHVHFEVRKNGIPTNPVEYLSNL